METQPPEENSSSKIFTYIAVTFVAVALVAVGAVFFITKRSLSISIVAKEDTKVVNVPIKVTVGDSGTGSSVTTSVFAYSQTFYPTGTKSVDGVAMGRVTLHNNTSSPQPLVKITRLLTKEGVLFRLSDKVVVPANGKVQADVYADQPGKAGNIGPSQFTIPGLDEEKQKVIYATSDEAFAGGVRTSAILSQKDIDEAKKEYKEKVLSAFAAGETKPGTENTATIATVLKDTITVDKKVGEEITSFTLSGTNTIVSVTYTKDEVLAALQKELRNTIDITSEKIVSAAKEPKVTLKSYNPATGVAEMSVVQEVVVTIDPNADKLAPVNFFGKSRDEIERYIVALDHVGKVEVKLSPSWIDSAPKSPDRIKVVVKDM